MIRKIGKQMNKFRAIIIGGTGATGRQLIKQLITNKNCDMITSLSRRPVLDGKKNDKLKDIVVNSLFDLSSTRKYWKNNHIFFNCIGTTRKRAGGSNGFIDVELRISKIAANLAEEAKIQHAIIISAKGANHNIFAPKFIHPLLYIKTMGQKENTVLSNCSFKKVAIFRPGMLIRDLNNKNILKTFFSKFNFGLKVDLLASAMILNAERVIKGLESSSVNILSGNKDIKSYLKNE